MDVIGTETLVLRYEFVVLTIDECPHKAKLREKWGLSTPLGLLTGRGFPAVILDLSGFRYH